MKLLCFPFAGGTSNVFLKWGKYFEDIKIIPVDPPGRGRRMGEPLCQTIESMIDDIKNQISALIDRDEEYVVYGHSMGSLLIYELLHELPEMNLPMPVHVFLSGKNPPHVAHDNPVHQLNDEEFIKKVIEFGGTEARIFDNPTLSKLHLPILRADLCAVETYRYEKKKHKLPLDMSFFYSFGDYSLETKQINQWSDYITGSLRIYSFIGGHFFIFDETERITKMITDTLLEVSSIIPY